MGLIFIVVGIVAVALVVYTLKSPGGAKVELNTGGSADASPDLSHEIAVLKEEREKLKTENAALEEKLQELKKEDSDLRDQLSRTKEWYARNQEALENAKKENIALKDKIKALETQSEKNKKEPSAHPLIEPKKTDIEPEKPKK
jgi:chromosome segregation ATPase